MVKRLAGNLDLMRNLGGLQGVDRQVEQNLQQVGAVDLRRYIGAQIVNHELVAVGTGMPDEKILQVRQHLPDANVSPINGVGIQEAEISPRNLKAAPDLSGKIFEIRFDMFKL